MAEDRKLHSGPGMRRLLDTLGQGAPPPAEPSRFDQTSPDGLVRLTLDADGTCTIDIDHFGAESEQGTARIEAAIKTLYNQAGGKTGGTAAKPQKGPSQ